jgi:diacylglycerol kinase
MQSVKDAWRGLGSVFRRERNFRIQLFAATVALVAASALGIRRADWMTLIILILFVLLLELLNSAAEHFLDVLRPRLHTQVKLIKEMMAGAVLLAAVGAVAVGALLFAPYIVERLGGL